MVKFSVYLNRRDFVMRIIWAATSENEPSDMCAQQRFGSAFAFAQSDQSALSAWRNLLPWLSKIYPVKILNRLCECVGIIRIFIGRTAHVRRSFFFDVPIHFYLCLPILLFISHANYYWLTMLDEYWYCFKVWTCISKFEMIYVHQNV